MLICAESKQILGSKALAKRRANHDIKKRSKNDFQFNFNARGNLIKVFFTVLFSQLKYQLAARRAGPRVCALRIRFSYLFY